MPMLKILGNRVHSWINLQRWVTFCIYCLQMQHIYLVYVYIYKEKLYKFIMQELKKICFPTSIIYPEVYNQVHKFSTSLFHRATEVLILAMACSPATATVVAAPLSPLWLCVLYILQQSASFSGLEKVIFACLYHSQTLYTNRTRYRNCNVLQAISKFTFGRIL